MNVKWDESTMRDWLNGTDDYDDETGSKYNGTWNFFDKAFTKDQADSIVITTNKTPASVQSPFSPFYGTVIMLLYAQK